MPHISALEEEENAWTLGDGRTRVWQVNHIASQGPRHLAAVLPAVAWSSQTMPKLTRSPSHHRYAQPVPTPLSLVAPSSTMSYYPPPQPQRSVSGYYGEMNSTGSGSLSMSSFDPYAVPSMSMPPSAPSIGG